MAKSDNQKLKMMYIRRMLEERSDYQHPLSMQDILNELEANDIKAERKSIYSDMEMLERFGMDIMYTREKPAGYYLASREFELPELKLLVDAIQSSKFITENKSRELIKKLESLASVHDASKLQRHVLVANRVKSMNSSCLINVDKIHQAMLDNVKVSFQYAEWTAAKKLEPKKNGKRYEISPWSLTWSDENYYMIGYDSEKKMVKHYRVDKMLKMDVTRKARDGKEAFKNFDLAQFDKQTFGMFAGDKQDLTLVCSNKLIGVIFDRFGTDIPVIPVDDKECRVRVKVNVSDQFFGWLCGLGTGVKIVEPANVADDYRKYLKNIAKMYKDK